MLRRPLKGVQSGYSPLDILIPQVLHAARAGLFSSTVKWHQIVDFGARGELALLAMINVEIESTSGSIYLVNATLINLYCDRVSRGNNTLDKIIAGHAGANMHALFNG